MRLLLESISGIGLLLKQILSNQKHISRRKLSKHNNQITMKALSPYMFCNAACGDIYAESLKNINKFRKRSSNTIDFGAIEVLEDQMDIEAPELGIRLILSEGLSVCTPLQRERIQKYYIEGMSLSEIAEGKNISTVQQSIDAGIKKMKNFFGVDP